MKTVRLVHPSHARTISSPEEADRLMGLGWIEPARPLSKAALKYRKHRHKLSLMGYRRFSAYLSPDDFDALSAFKLPGESGAQLLIRLLHLALNNPSSKDRE